MAKVGRPKGSVKPKTVNFHRRVRPEIAKILNEITDKLKKELKDNEQEIVEKLRDRYLK